LIGATSFNTGSTIHKLTARDGGVCVTGTRDSAGSPVVVVFQLGSNGGKPLDTLGSSAFVIDHAGAPTLFFLAQRSDLTGALYRNEIAPGVSRALAEGPQRIPFSQLAAIGGGNAWEPSQLEAVRLVVGDGEAGPFDVCITQVGFE
jgi:hypothetical protein